MSWVTAKYFKLIWGLIPNYTAKKLPWPKSLLTSGVWLRSILQTPNLIIDFNQHGSQTPFVAPFTDHWNTEISIYFPEFNYTFVTNRICLLHEEHPINCVHMTTHAHGVKGNISVWKREIKHQC